MNTFKTNSIQQSIKSFLGASVLLTTLTLVNPQKAHAQCDDCFPTKFTTKNDVDLKLSKLRFNEKDLYNDIVEQIVSDGEERKQFDQIWPTLNLKRKATIFILMDQAKENKWKNLSRAACIYYCLDPDLKYSLIGGWVKKEVIEKGLTEYSSIEDQITTAEFNIPVYILSSK